MSNNKHWHCSLSVYFIISSKNIIYWRLTGADNKTPHHEIQACTKACHGLFPKRLALEATCYLAELMGIEEIIAVGNATHIYQNWRYRAKKK